MIPGKSVYAYSGIVAIAQSGNTEVCSVDVSGLEHVMVEITVAVNTLDAFLLTAKGHQKGPGLTLASATSDFTTPNAPVIKASGDLTGQTAGSGWVIVDVRGVRTLVISASSSSSGGSTVEAWVTGA